MNLALVDVVIATAAALCVGIAFTLWRFKAIKAHDRATTELLKRFFDGKQCAICKQPISPVHLTGLKPGLLDPTTHETHSWDEIPNVMSTALETQLPVCYSCEVAESFRQRFPGLVVDRDRSLQDAHSHD
jgi:hypothetical protein